MDTIKKWALVIPTIRPDQFKAFMAAWLPYLTEHGVFVVVIEDADTPSDFHYDELAGFIHLTRADKPDFIPDHTDMIRSWGFYYVWKNQIADYVLTLDDDVRPGDMDPFAAYELEFMMGNMLSKYLSVGSFTTATLQMRGFPYKDRKLQEVAVQYGGWNGVLDYDAATQLSMPQDHHKFKDYVVPVPFGAAATCCIMNCAFSIKYTPIMWQLPMLNGRYNRVGDIWSGLFIKKALDMAGKVMLINGLASVQHERASDPYVALNKEAPSAKLNDYLWDALPDYKQPLDFRASDELDTIIRCYVKVTDSAADYFKLYDLEYARHFRWARSKWLELFRASA